MIFLSVRERIKVRVQNRSALILNFSREGEGTIRKQIAKS
jgi:hypothetical protein